MLRLATIVSTAIVCLSPAFSAWAVDKEAAVGPHPVLDQVFAQYEKAFNAGDAKAIGALWKSDGEFVDPLGNRIVGREDIEKLFADYFSRNRGGKLSLKVLSLKTEEGGNVVVAEVVPDVSPPAAGQDRSQ